MILYGIVDFSMNVHVQSKLPHNKFILFYLTPHSCIAATIGCEADVILVIDKSGSMRSYYTELLEFCKKLVSGLDPRSRIGIVVFSHVASTAVRGTTLRDRV